MGEAEKERAAVVDWLRGLDPIEHGCRDIEHRGRWCSCFSNADAIERGDHITKEPTE